MYCSKVELEPTSGMTFRIMPGSNLDIATYPFVPPTTMSGFLRRVCMLSTGLALPQTAANTKDTPFYALPPHLLVTGAIPVGLKGTHKTHRKGPSNFGHTGFSKLHRAEMQKKENIQLHTWEYFFCQKLIGYVVTEKAEDLKFLTACLNWGCKLGKEGYAIVSAVTPPIKLDLHRCAAIPSTLLHPDDLSMEDLHQPLEFYGLYRYLWKQTTRSAPEDPAPSEIQGYLPMAVASPTEESHFTMDYLHDGEAIFIPRSWLEAIKGESIPLSPPA